MKKTQKIIFNNEKGEKLFKIESGEYIKICYEWGDKSIKRVLYYDENNFFMNGKLYNKDKFIILLKKINATIEKFEF